MVKFLVFISIVASCLAQSQEEKSSFTIKGAEAKRLYAAMVSPIKEGTQQTVLEEPPVKEFIEYRRGRDYTCYYRPRTLEYQCVAWLTPAQLENGWRIADRAKGELE